MNAGALMLLHSRLFGLLYSLPFGFLSVALLSGVARIVQVKATPFNWDKFWITGSCLSLLAWIVIVAMRYVNRQMFKDVNVCDNGERLLKHGPADYSIGWRPSNGWLYLTDQRIIAKASLSFLSPLTFDVCIYYDEILAIKPHRTWNRLFSGFCIEHKHGEVKFLVFDHEEWETVIEDARRASDFQHV